MKKKIFVCVETVRSDGSFKKEDYPIIDFVIEAMRIITLMMDGEIIKAEFNLFSVDSEN